MFRYQFNDFILDSQQHALIRAEKKINLGSIAYKILLYFVNNPNRTIHKQELISAVWENVIITDATLYKHGDLMPVHYQHSLPTSRPNRQLKIGQSQETGCQPFCYS